MKIAYVLNTYPMPSHSFIRREVQALERAGFQVTRLAMRRPDMALDDPRNRDEQKRTRYVLDRGLAALFAGLVGRAVRNPRATLSAARLAWRMARNAGGNPLRRLAYLAEAAHVADLCATAGLCHIHSHFGTNATEVAMLAHALGAPQYSFTTHGPEEFDEPRALSLAAKVEHSAFAVAISQFGRSQLSRWAAFCDWDKIKVVHCGIEPAAYADPTPVPNGPTRIAAIGRFVEQKGQMVLVLAMARLRDSHPDLHLTLLGDGPMRGDLERAIETHRLQDRITLTGWVDEDRVNGELAAAHALVMPSFAEGLPMVVMESMAAGRPVIATYIAGTPELLTPDAGWLVPAGDVAALADAIAELDETPRVTRIAMGQAGRARVLARHNIDTEAAKLAAHIRDAVAARA